MRESITLGGAPFALGQTAHGQWWAVGQAPSPDGGAFTLYATDGNPPPGSDRRQALLGRIAQLLGEVRGLCERLAVAPELAPLLVGASTVRPGRVEATNPTRTRRARDLANRALEGDVAPLVTEANRALITLGDSGQPEDVRSAAESCYRELALQAAARGVPVVDLQRQANAAGPGVMGVTVTRTGSGPVPPGLRRIAELAASHTVVPEVSKVRANALVGSPCLTREMLRARGYSEAALRNFMFDGLGCLIHQVIGRRIDDRCYQGTGTASSSFICVAPTIVTENALERMLAAASSAAGFLLPLLPSIGPGLGELFGPIVAEMFKGKSFFADLLGTELQALMGRVQATVTEVWTTVRGIVTDGAIKTFKVIGSTAKTIADAIPGSVVQFTVTDPGTLIAYAGVRESLGVAGGVLKGDLASTRMLESMAVDGLTRVRSYAEAKVARDVQKSLMSIQGAVDYVALSRGRVDGDVLRNLVGSLPDITDKSSGAIRSLSIPPEGIAPAAALVESFASKPKQMLASLDPGRLGALIPERALRSRFEQSMASALDFQAALSPAVDAADQSMQRALDYAGGIVRDRNARLPDGDWVYPESIRNLYGVSLENYVRGQVVAAEAEAERIVQTALASLPSRPTTAAPRVALSIQNIIPVFYEHD